MPIDSEDEIGMNDDLDDDYVENSYKPQTKSSK